jgi:ABC-type polysaccharide/polyol phosphate transport system ATPase subunit
VSELVTADPPVDAGHDLPAIEVRDLHVQYTVRLDSGKLGADLRRMIKREPPETRVIPAVQGISFDVEPGSVMAIVGRNGAGKSTLLQAITGVLVPHSGSIVVRGRMNLLAPGLGMNDNLTGRENIRLGGLATGIEPERLELLIEEIAEFAQLGEFIEFPMRAYSTGMKARLAAAVAVHLDPEILLIDEALTGGDAAFIEHTAEKVAQLTGQGRTILLVTHGLSSVLTMATDAIWMHQGQIAERGEPIDVINAYMRYCRLESMSLEFDDQ